MACGILVVACEFLAVASGIKFPDQGSNPSSLHWECQVSATGPPGKSLALIFKSQSRYQLASQVVLVTKSPRAIAGDIRDTGLIPGLGSYPGGEHDNPLQYSCLENPKDRGTWRATQSMRSQKSQTQLSD